MPTRRSSSRLMFTWKRLPWLVLWSVAVVPVGASAVHAEPAAGDDRSAEPVSYHRQVEPIFRSRCFGCHQGAKQLGDYRMTEFSSLLRGGESGEPAVVPGDAEASYLVQQITPTDGFAEMPKAPAKPLRPEEVSLISRWITEGAVDDSPPADTVVFNRVNPPRYQGPAALPSIDVATEGDRDVALLAVAGFHEVLLLDLNTGERLDRLVGMSPRINTVRFSPDGKYLAAVGGTPGESGEVQIWEVAGGELALSLPLTFDTLCGAAWSPDGSRFAFGGNDNVVRAIDVSTGEVVLYQGAHEDWVRDVAFTEDGSHLVSVARDMTCKLTELETERFIDNITSITPGALSGGLNTVTRHPDRDEILIGGADGIAKVYRIFRQTARKIGDDANLIRAFPEMQGRIFSVAISPDGSRLAAASTLDGRSQVRVWKYNFDGTLSEQVKKILAKQVRARSDEEKAVLAKQRQAETRQLVSYDLDDASVYAISFGPDRSLVVAADDGHIRHLDANGELIRSFSAMPDLVPLPASRLAFDAPAWAEGSTEVSYRSADSPNRTKKDVPVSDDTAGSTSLDPSQFVDLTVSPPSIHFTSPYDYTQLVVTGTTADGETQDVTRQCDYEVPGWTMVSDRARVRPSDDGAGELTVHFGTLRRSVDVTAAGIRPASENDFVGSVDFIRDVNPVLSRLGCNQGTCHGAQKGKNGFRLSLRGYDPVFDLRAFTDDLAARRVNAASPDDSMMLRKPLGLTPHEGGVLMSEGDPYHTILRRWIADGCQLDLDVARVAKIEIFPLNPVVQKIGANQQVRVVAVFPDGSRRDVTGEAFIESGNTEVAAIDQRGLLTAIRRGEAPILARYEGAYAATTLTVMGDRSGYEAKDYEVWNRVDELVADKWERVKVVPSPLCDDATFLRRVHLDLTGLPPTSDEVRQFLADDSPTRLKRAEVVDRLIGSPAFVDYWTNKWADLLQVNRKYLGVEGSRKFRDWIHRSVADNRPYDQFVEQILTATGSNKENPAASYFKVLRNAEDTMENTTHLFLGIRFNCNKCHDHPFERWTQDQYYEMAAFFARTDLKRDPASGSKSIGGTAVEDSKPLYEVVYDSEEGDVEHPTTGEAVPPTFPFDVPHDSSDDDSRREKLAAWMTDSDNPYFARSYVNRVWGYLLGVGLIEPLDDIRAGNPPTNPELLDHLTSTFVDSGFDFHELLRTICNSRTYQLSVETNPLNEGDALNYSHALARRLPAEVIYDTVHAVTGATSRIPGVPAGTRAAALTDAGVKLPDGFLQNLGRPVRESACECERSDDLQLGPVMALISGPTVGSAISDPKNDLAALVRQHPKDASLAEELFLRALGRLPREEEIAAFKQMLGQIEDDHQALLARLADVEADWERRRPALLRQRESDLAKLRKQIAEREQAIHDERQKLEQERLKQIDQAETALAEFDAKLDETAADWEDQQRKELAQSPAQWYPLQAIETSTTNGMTLIPQPDRSIVATGAAKPGEYEAIFRTGLRQITGLRIEVLPDPELPGGGPGLSEDGNFVLSEISLMAGTAGEPDSFATVGLGEPLADFSEAKLEIREAVNETTAGNDGWSVGGSTGVVHWATFTLKKPLPAGPNTQLHVELSQVHERRNSRLGRFRISVTTDVEKAPLGLAESLSAVLVVPAEKRTEAQTSLIRRYVKSTDAKRHELLGKLSKAQRPVPADEELARMTKRLEQLSGPLPDDPVLVQLRKDVRHSEQQRRSARLTAAEDLTWALINSPAFLFNH